jgi:tetratricopeptide (TPR) repeat protein
MQGADRRQFERLCRQADFLLHTKRYALCIDYALKALAIILDDPRPHVQIAYAKARLKDSEAPEWARKAIALEPENAQWHAALADTYSILGKWHEALTPMQDAVKLDPEKPGFQSGMGQCLTFLGKAKEALPYLERALELNPQSAVTHARMSVALFKTGDTKGSSQHLRKALELKPDDPNLQTLLGWEYTRKGKRKQGNEAFYEALRIDPKMASAKLGIGARLGSRFSMADIFLRAALSNPGGKRLLGLRIFLALFLLFETSTSIHGIYLWPVWGVELVLLFAFYRVAHRVLRFVARRKGINAV